MTNKYNKGRQLEYKIKRKYESQDDTLLVIRSAGSHGPADLVIIKKNCVILCQVKYNKNIKDVNKIKEIEYMINMVKKNNIKIPIKIALNDEIVYE